MASKDVAVESGKRSERESRPASEQAFAPLVELRHRMDDLFDDITKSWGRPLFSHSSFNLRPFAEPLLTDDERANLIDANFDVSEDEKAIEISAELPGMDEADVEVTVDDGVLVIRGEKKSETEEKEKNYYRSERSFGSVMRSFRLPETVDQAKIKASMSKGVLELSLPKNAQAKMKAKKIPVSNTK